MLQRFSAFVMVFFISVCSAQAQTDKKAIDQNFFEFDIYPFELTESSGKWGLKFKEVYERALAINFLKRNFHYNNRVDTLVNNTWLALPFYTKFERWSYGPRFQFLVGTRGAKVDVFTLSGEILGSDVTEFLPEKVNLEKSDVVMTLKTGTKWKWYYEGDFYNKNTTIYYSSPEFDKLEVVRDTTVANFVFNTEVQGIKQRYNVVGHELSGTVVAYNKPSTPVAVKEQQPVAQAEKNTGSQKEIKTVQQDVAAGKITASSSSEPKGVSEAELKAAVAKALKEADEAHARELKATEAKLAAETDREIAVLKAQLEEERKARVIAEKKLAAETKRADDAEQKAKKEEEDKIAALLKLNEALKEANAALSKSMAVDTKSDCAEQIKVAVANALKEVEEKENKASEQKAQEEARLIAENEKAQKAAEAKAKAEEEQKNNALKVLKEAEEKAKAAEEKRLKEEEIKAAVSKALKETEEKERKEAEQKNQQETEQKAAFAKALQEAEEKARTEARLKADAEAKRAAEEEKAKLLAEIKEQKQPATPAVSADTVDMLQDKNVIMQKIMNRDKLISYSFFKENGLVGLKSAEGKVLIYPVMNNINIVAPSNRELKYVTHNAAIEFELDGMLFRITNPDFDGPEYLGNHAIKCTTCSSGFKSVEVKWNATKGRYTY